MGGSDVVINVDVQEVPPLPQSGYRHQHVTPKLPNRPGLAILDEFMDPYIHIHKSEGVQEPIRCPSLERFKLAMRPQNSRTDTDTSEVHLRGWVAEADRSGTIILAEDLSVDMIELLGTKYSVEPEFFAGHLRGSEAFRTGEWLPVSVRAPKILPSCIRQAPFYTVEFRRPYHLSKGLEDVIYLRSRVTNIPRGAQVIKGLLDVYFPDVFVFEKVSVYKKKDSKIGIILTEKLLADGPPAPQLLDPVSSLNGNFPRDRSKQVSCRDELIGWLQQVQKEEALALFDDNNTEPLALCPILKVIEAASVMFLAYAQYTMSRIIKVTRHRDEEFPDSIQFAVRVLRYLHEQIHDQQRFLQDNLRVAYLQGSENKEQTEDIESLVQDLGRALKAFNEDVRFFTFTASIRQGKLVAMVSKLAFLFVPVSTWAAVMSISGPGQEGYTRFIIFGILTLLSLLVSTFIIFLWKPSNVESIEF